MCTNTNYLRNFVSSKRKVYESTFSTYKETPELPLHFTCPHTTGARAKIAYERDPTLVALLTSVISYSALI